MSPIFKPKRKIADFETETSLPDFWVDVNGFIMFENEELGGCGIFEVTPRVMTAAITHEDPIHPSQDTENADYMPSTGSWYGDRRKDVYPAWVHFVNALQAEDESEDPIHVQILLKKVRTDEWDTRVDYAFYETMKDIERLDEESETDPHAAILKARTQDYLNLLNDVQKEIRESATNRFDLRCLPSYKTKMYMAISYTPSSEGWWIDGRDSDYYVSDTWSPTNIFKEDKIVDKITDRLMKKHEKDATKTEDNTAEDIFWIESDKTAQTIETRMRKIEKIIRTYCRENKTAFPFCLRRLESKETAALVKFFPNILTPYVGKLDKLSANYNDIYHQLDSQVAIATGDTSLITMDSEELIYGGLDLRQPETEEEAFLRKFQNKAPETLQDVRSEYVDKNWDAEKAVDEMDKQQQKTQKPEGEDLWTSIDPSYTLDADDEQSQEEFLERFKSRSLTVEHAKANEEIKKEALRKGKK